MTLLDRALRRKAPTRHTILFLAANPRDTSRMALDQEASDLHAVLERSGFRDSFVLETRWAVKPLDLLHELRKRKPTVVHFSGHGSSDGPRVPPDAAWQHRDVTDEDDAASTAPRLYFQGRDGGLQPVSAEGLAGMFGAAGSSVKLVVLNACYSAPHAAALLDHVDCVVGMRGSIRDDAARTFAVGFFGGLGERESVAAAYRQGCAAIGAEGLPDGDLPQLESRQGIDAEQLVLASLPTPPIEPPTWLLLAAGLAAAAVATAIYAISDEPDLPTLKVDSVLESYLLTATPDDPASPQAVRVVMRAAVEAESGDLCFAQASESSTFAGPLTKDALKEASGAYEEVYGCEQAPWDFLIPLAKRTHLAGWHGWVRVALRRDDRIFVSVPVAVDVAPAQGEANR